MTFRAHFDGHVLVPEAPVDLPADCPLQVEVVVLPTKEAVDRDKAPLAMLAELAAQFPENPDWPPDGAAQLDHYLYGTPKRP